ncbi:MAG TPA: cytochrome P450 [Solirubrobacterales bacterium]
MTAVAELELPAFDYSDPELTGEPWHDAVRAARERGWLARAEPIGFFVLEREAAAFFLRTPKATFPGTRILELQGVTEGPLWERLKGNLLDLDGEDHRRLRKLVQPAFTPPAADRHRPAMRRHLADLFEPVSGGGAFEATAALTKPYPARMIAELMGAPLADAERLGVWANLIQGQFDPIKVANEREALERAAAEFVEYTRALIADRHDDPGDDLISVLIAAEEEGDRLSADEVVHLTSAILVGGVDTTQAQLAHALILFARHPDQWELLAGRPELAPQAVEEILRYEPITPITARITLEDIEYDGVTFPEGTLLFAAAVAANRDPAAYEEPERFDITAERGRAKPLTFGAGPHFCLGANLARAELQEALAFLAPRMPGLALEAEPVYDTPLGIYAVEELRLGFEPGPRAGHARM